MDRTARAIVVDILASPFRGRPAKTVFFGGGTPTFFSGSQLADILAAVREVHPFDEQTEVTSEANPGTADSSKFAAMRAAGFNRLSLGAQSFLPSDLIALGRVHGSDEIGRAVQLGREAGFHNMNLDLMFALPGQTLQSWQKNLDKALATGVEHLSLYCLTLEPNTPFHKKALRGELTLPSEGTQVEMFNFTSSVMEDCGFKHYEISNFARGGRECQHNLCYWRGEEYAGYGPGAVGAVVGMEGKVRTTKTKRPETYCEQIERGEDAIFEREPLDDNTLRIERIMLGLRLAEGIPASWTDPKGLQEAVGKGWVTTADARIRLTPEGKHFCSAATVLLI